MIKEVPLFWRLTPEKQAKLMQYYWDNFGLRLEIPPEPKDIKTNIEDVEEIDKIMRGKPHYEKGSPLRHG